MCREQKRGVWASHGGLHIELDEEMWNDEEAFQEK